MSTLPVYTPARPHTTPHPPPSPRPPRPPCQLPQPSRPPANSLSGGCLHSSRASGAPVCPATSLMSRGARLARRARWLVGAGGRARARSPGCAGAAARRGRRWKPEATRVSRADGFGARKGRGARGMGLMVARSPSWCLGALRAAMGGAGDNGGPGRLLCAAGEGWVLSACRAVLWSDCNARAWRFQGGDLQKAGYDAPTSAIAGRRRRRRRCCRRCSSGEDPGRGWSGG
jgi:hypothetical protein